MANTSVTKQQKKDTWIHYQIVKNYDLKTISKRNIASRTFTESLDFDDETRKKILALGQSALLNNGVVFAYENGKLLRSVFIVEKHEKSFDCDFTFIDGEVSPEDKEDMEKDIMRQIALLNYYAKFEKGTYLGRIVPKVQKVKRPSGWAIALLISIGFAFAMYPVTKNIGFSVATGLCQFALWYSILNSKLVLLSDEDSRIDQ